MPLQQTSEFSLHSGGNFILNCRQQFNQDFIVTGYVQVHYTIIHYYEKVT